MTSEANKEQGEEPETGDDASREGGINDPLTRSDVEAPRAPFGSDPKWEE